MIRLVPCSCGNTRPEVMTASSGHIVIRCKRCGQAVVGSTYDDAEDRWREQVTRWLDMRSEIDQRMGVD